MRGILLTYIKKFITIESIKCVIRELFYEGSYNLIDFIKMYYPDSNIPMYLFVGEKCTFCMPEQGELTHPPMKYIENLLYSKKKNLILYYKIWNYFLRFKGGLSGKWSACIWTDN